MGMGIWGHGRRGREAMAGAPVPLLSSTARASAASTRRIGAFGSGPDGGREDRTELVWWGFASLRFTRSIGSSRAASFGFFKRDGLLACLCLGRS
jgi:hypothetical protein